MIRRFFITKRQPFAGGHEFAITGAYEKLVGRLYGEVDPKHKRNKIIVNLDKAPRNRRGRVEYSTSFCILKPTDMARGNGKLFYDAPNRGGKRILAFLNDGPQSNDPTTLQDAGNGFLMRQGYTIVWCGWQGDLIPAKNWLVLQVPIASNSEKEIVAKTRTEIVVDEQGIKSQPLSGDERVQSYEAATLDKSEAALTVREKSYGPRIAVPSDEWEFARCFRGSGTGKEKIRASSTDLYLRRGFRPGHIYEFIYWAKNPLVLGLGFAVVRDLVSFLRYEVKDQTGRLNPFAFGLKKNTSIRYAYGWGRSQSGRFLRDLVYHGFNEDEAHRKVFDAIAPHVAGGGRIFLNYEFARPVSSSQQHTDQLDPELFPHAYNVLRDAQTGRRDGILKRPKTDPVVFHTQTSTEYWQKRGCLAHTDGKGRDVPLPENVRLYVIASAQHNSPFGSEAVRENTQQKTNPLPAGDVLRALMVSMDLWIAQGIAPPPSQYPRVRDATLVPSDRNSTGFPDIPGLRYSGLHNRQLFLDYGPSVHRGCVTLHPPQNGTGAYIVLVPKVDSDGNDIAGIRLPAIQAPLGTYTGWNLRPRGLAQGELAGLLGSYVPFSRTAAERRKNADPRLSIEERYRDRVDYVQQVSRAARMLVEQRYLLAEDAERIIREAKKVRL
ncbi:MAG TPA: alpha/beta hydrolase domain-containing protein [Candidatus Binatia bacterium]|nr:alpha/beta hydrolase domain-containing protein [Candidatus Binatia bacterium]